MAAALRRLSGLFSKPETTNDREFYSRPRESSSSSSRSSSHSESSSDSNRPQRRSSWLKRKASKAMSPTSPTAGLESKRGGTRLSNSRITSYFDATLPSWHHTDVACPPIHTRPRGGGSWNFNALDEVPSSDEDVHATDHERARGERTVLAESSAQAQRRLDGSPSHRRSVQRRTGSNSSNYWNRLSARSATRTDPAEGETEIDRNAYADESGLRDGGVSLNHSVSSAREETSTGSLAWRNAITTSTSRSSARKNAGLYRDRLARWSEYSPVPDAESHEDRDQTESTQAIPEEEHSDSSSDEEHSDSSSDEEHWWSDEDDQDGPAEHTITETTIPDVQTQEQNTSYQAGKTDDPELQTMRSRVEAEIDSLYSDRPFPQDDRQMREPSGEAEPNRSTEEIPLCVLDEQLIELERAAREIDEQVMEMVQAMINKCEEGGANVDKRALMLAQEEVRYLEHIGEQMRGEMLHLRALKEAEGHGPSGANTDDRAEVDPMQDLDTWEDAEIGHRRATLTAAIQEELDRRHALRLQEEIERDGEQPAAFTEQEELDRQHALQLQQDMATEQEEAQRQLEADSMRDCTVCADSKSRIDFPLKAATERCQHQPGLCYDCLQSWMASELDSKGCDGFKCPECPEKMDFEDVREAASEETFAAYDKLAMRSALGGLEEFAWCLRSGCGNGQLNIENNHYMICQACGYRQCLKHRIQWHHGETCDEYDYRVSGRKAADEARERREAADRSKREEEEKKQRNEAQRKLNEERKTEAMIGTVSKACPEKCGRRIQRTHGCDHMTCKCGAEWCWECLAPQKRIDRVGNTAHEMSCKNHSNNLR